MLPPLRLDPRYRTLDSWRGFACLIVVLHHAGFVFMPADAVVDGRVVPVRRAVLDLYHRFDLGVPLFFVISGYCIAASMDAQRRRGASSWGFLARRAWRIYPPYWAAVAVFAATVAGLRWLGWGPIVTGTHSLHLDAPGELTWQQWLGNLTLTETWRPIVFGGDLYRNFTRISWTLCFEEQFYLVGFGLLLAFPRRLFGAIGLASAVFLAIAAAAYDASWFFKLEGTFLGRWYEFAVGLAVYWRLVQAGSPEARRAVDVGLGGLGLLGWWYGSTVMVAVAAFGLVLVALRPVDAALDSRRVLAPFRACGRRCYSIYLIHLPACTVGSEALVQLGWDGFWTKALVVAPLVATAGVAAGWAFYAAVEVHFARGRPRGEVAAAPARPARGGEPAPPAAATFDPLGTA